MSYATQWLLKIRAPLHIRNMRQKGNQLLPVPRSDDLQFVLPRQYCVTTENDQFLQVNNYANGSLMLVFGSQVAIDYLRSCDHWHMDGTFDTVPPQFLQLYTIHGIKNRRNVIGLYGLLTNKTPATYEQFVQHVRYLVGVNPISINLDCEIAAINACQLMFPQANLRGCFFHLCQNIFKKVQANNLRNIQRIPTTILPLNFIVWAFERLCQHCGNAEQPILQYFIVHLAGHFLFR